MAQSRTRWSGMDVHTDAMAVAYGAQDHGAEVASLGTMGTRQCAIDPRIRKRQSPAQHRVGISEAGPWGSWRSRSLRHQDADGGVGAPSRIPPQAGERGKTARRDAVPLARRARAGALTAVEVPQGEEAAMRALTRARADTLRARQDAQWRLTAFWRSHALRSTGRANGSPAHRRWLSAGRCPPPAPPIVLQADVRAGHAHPARLQRLEPARHEHVHAWRLPPVVEALQA